MKRRRINCADPPPDGAACPREKQVAPTLSIFAGDVRPFAGQTINVFAEESLPTSLSWPEKPDWAERLKGKSKLMFNWWPGASCAFVKLDTGASWWSQAARAESGFGGAGAYQNTSVVQSYNLHLFQSATTRGLDGSIGCRQRLLVFLATAVTNQFPHV